MPDTALTASYHTALNELTRLEQSQTGLQPGQLRAVLDTTLEQQGLSGRTLEADQLEVLLFPELDSRLENAIDTGVLSAEDRRAALRHISELLAAQQLEAMMPGGAAQQNASALDDLAEDDWEFGEDDFELDDPEYVSAPSLRRYDLSQSADQDRLITELGRVSGVQSVMVCRQNGEVVQSRSLNDLTKLGSVVAATVMLLRGRSLRLMSAQVGGTVVCVRPMGEHAVAVLADPGVNIGRLLSELGQLQEAV
ncbi:roadblock/LC7 domain-containing protein [Deinococcus radiophilus]|uniref:Roadblock/LC7 domain-containing protein n=2 Tax=Deinococcus radiophilus TaxID=32062 RepID=A0A431W375_9DEIO|nr:roadblock/LC7 domain-containing protein [Deinococcus radiophilus]RTR29909.1 roadblock/LC7 domain-containing protein [Deinococcus radiophilus]UFA49737.1 roadblock/LC7 domain-containing protein [Deinococcus radiophilus]